MKNKKIFILLLVIFLITLVTCFNFVSALTGSIGNAKAVLYPEVGFFGVTIDRTILVTNVNDVPVKITIEATGNNSKMFKIIDKEFLLESGEEKEARFQISINDPGSYEGRVNVFFKPEEGSSAGVALSSEILIYAIKKGATNTTNTDSDTDSENNQNTVNNASILDSKNSTISKKDWLIGFGVVFEVLIVLILAILIVVLILKKKSKNNKNFSKEERGLKIRKRSARSL
jgi:hypothetical protein